MRIFNTIKNYSSFTIHYSSFIATLEEDVFYDCIDLSKVNIEGKLNRIEGWAFYNCCNIKEIVIPGDIEYIGQRAFQNWGEDQTIYFECSESNEKNWNYNSDETTE